MKKRTLLERMASAPHLVWMVLFIVAPLLFVAYYAFTTPEGAFTFDNLLAPGNHAETFAFSVCMSLISTVICLLIGYPLAYCISRASARAQKILIMLIMLPMWTNFIIRTYALSEVLEVINNAIVYLLSLLPESLVPIALDPKPDIVIYNETAVVVGMVYDFLPYMVLPIYTSMTKLDKKYLEAAADLGCNAFGVLRKVILPLSLSGVISGVTMVLVPSISTFYISQKLGGGTIMLIGDTIERQMQVQYNYNLGAALSLVLMVLILVSMMIMNKFSDDDMEGGLVA